MQKNCRKIAAIPNQAYMATLVYELGKPKLDGSRKVAIILSHKGRRKRIPTNITVKGSDISKRGNITSRKVQKTIDDKINELKNRLYDLEMELMDREVDVDWLYNRLLRKKDDVDFFIFTENWLEKSGIKGKKNYTTMLNALERFLGVRKLSSHSLTIASLTGSVCSLESIPGLSPYTLGKSDICITRLLENITPNMTRLSLHHPLSSTRYQSILHRQTTESSVRKLW